MNPSVLAQAYSATGAAWQAGPGRVYDRLAEVLVEASPVTLTGRMVLDLGAGTGAVGRAVHAAGGTVVAADLAIGMLQAITRPRPASVVADALVLPLATGSLDGVIAAFSLNHLPDPRPALREARRVARAGSPLLVSAYATDDGHPVKDATYAAAAELGWRPDAWVEQLRTSSIPMLASVDGARGIAQEAGLREPAVRRVEVGFPHLSIDDLVAWRCGMAQLAPFVATLSPAQRARLHQRAVDLLGDAPTLTRRLVVITALA